MEAASVEGPVRKRERLILMDGLRGFALWGILLVNLRSMSAPSMAYGHLSIWSGALAEGVEWAMAFFLDGAFWTLFALLFGAGFSVMMGQSGPSRDGIGLPAYYRRIGLIGVFGMAHVFFLWWGDILMVYALAGACLPLFRNCRSRTLWIWAGLLIGLPLVIYLALISLGAVMGAAAMEEWSRQYTAETKVWIDFLVGGYRSADIDVVHNARWNEFTYNVWTITWILPAALGLMLIGTLLSRKSCFVLKEWSDRFACRLLWGSLAVALVGKALYLYGYVTSDSFSLTSSAAFLLGAKLGGIGTAFLSLCLFRKLYLSNAAPWLQRGLAAAGRMALTLYLMQSFIAGWIFYGYGLGLYGQVGPPGLCLLGFIIFAGQVVFARLWLSRFHWGPLEFLLRRFTYRRAH